MKLPRYNVLSSSLLFWYLVWGVAHELGHALVAAVLLTIVDYDDDNDPIPILQWNSLSFWVDLLFHRKIVIQLSAANDDFTVRIDRERWIRWGGMLLSLWTAWLVSSTSRRQRRQNANQNHTDSFTAAELAAWITVLESCLTDGVFCLNPEWARIIPIVGETIHNPYPFSTVFYCGNFGLILLHHMWFQDRTGREAALDGLQQMIQITMMRGAQSGGVVTYQPHATDGSTTDLQAKRYRVVNKKRTDLSQTLRQRVQIPTHLPKDFVPILSGHTRFATSSKASLDGTHPHQWTVPTVRRIYDFDTKIFRNQTIETFITHNGDLEFFVWNHQTVGVERIMPWLEQVLDSPAPAPVDSMGIAGLIEVIRCQGCFALAVRYVVALGTKNTKIANTKPFPSMTCFDQIGNFFEMAWKEMENNRRSSKQLGDENEVGTDLIDFRTQMATATAELLSHQNDLMDPLKKFGVVNDEEDSYSLYSFCLATTHAFLDHDLFYSTQLFLKAAKGSFGLTVSSSWDAHRRLVVAARGQSMSIAFYPDKGLICYGSEQAAVKAGWNMEIPNGKNLKTHFPEEGLSGATDVDKDATRLDLDDLGGEVVLLDWSPPQSGQIVSTPSRHLPVHTMMHGKVNLVIHQESKCSSSDHELYHRLTRLTRNDLIQPLPNLTKDPILTDIQDIPRVCRGIQEDFHSSKTDSGMNRLTAFHLSICLKKRLEKRIRSQMPDQSIDILLTGCEVSLWLAEQFASDLKKCFPKLTIQALSSNKILGMYGQEMAIPSLGFPVTQQTQSYHNTIVIIVSHSGGTFAPRACSNLLQSTTKNIFAVTGDWDTQIGKNLRLMNQMEDGGEHVLNHRIFCTNIGIRPAEPCSLSVVATHQLLTNLLKYISVVILSDSRYRRVTGAVVTAMDIEILQRCSQMNLNALSEIVGVNTLGYEFDQAPRILRSLREAGDLWSEHILENVRAYIMCFTYIFTTVISGYPMAYAIAYGAGLASDSPWVHVVKIIDAAIYFWCPQICIFLLRFLQGRNLRHRMTARTVVIGDIPWVAQSAEAFLSKIFAVSYSISSIQVLSGNPADHLVHRHTHRIVRGTLAIFGRPDGRLSALSTAEASVCLSVNQASSIQSWGGTCESVTIGHNPYQLELSLNGIFLKRHRPLFLCERLLVESDAQQEVHEQQVRDEAEEIPWRRGAVYRFKEALHSRNTPRFNLSASVHHVADCSISLRVNKRRSAPALLGAYLDING